MDLIFDIAEYLDIPNEYIKIDMVIGNMVWFSTKTGKQYTATSIRNGKRLKKDSIRS